MKVIGHRGFCGVYPENTLISIVKAIEVGVHAVEVDVRATKDNVLILFHDDKLDRLTGVKGYVREKTFDYISKLRVKNERILTFKEFLELVKKYQNVHFFVEIKEPDTVNSVIDEIESVGLRDRITLISFYHNALKIAKDSFKLFRYSGRFSFVNID